MNPKTPGLRFGLASALLGMLIALAPTGNLSRRMPLASARTKRKPHWTPPPLTPEMRAEIARHNDEVAVARRKHKRAQDARFEARFLAGDPVNHSKRRSMYAITGR